MTIGSAVLVTGGAGFIGHHLVHALSERDTRIVVLDDLSTGRRDRLAGLEDRIDVIEGSILDVDAIEGAIGGTDVVFHQAALASVARSLADPRRSNEVNVTGTINVLLAAARARVRRFVFAGSSSVYGVPARLPSTEADRPSPLSPYAVSKLAAEQYVHVLGRQLGLETVVLRYFNVFGPGQDPASEYAAVVPRFVTAVLEGSRPTINGSDEISRDFTYIDNVVSANLLAASADASGVTLNIAGGESTTLSRLLWSISEVAGRSVDPLVGPAREGDIRHSLADISLARSSIGYEVKVPVADGIRRTVAWYREAIDRAR